MSTRRVLKSDPSVEQGKATKNWMLPQMHIYQNANRIASMVRAYTGRNRPGISRIGVVIVVIVILVVAGGVGYFYLVPPPATKGSTLKIGMTLSQSGIFASLDGNYTHFNDAWQSYVNSNGGLVDGSGVHHNVTIISYDDQSQHDLAVSQ